MLTGEGGICDTDSSALQKYVLRGVHTQMHTGIERCACAPCPSHYTSSPQPLAGQCLVCLICLRFCVSHNMYFIEKNTRPTPRLHRRGRARGHSCQRQPAFALPGAAQNDARSQDSSVQHAPSTHYQPQCVAHSVCVSSFVSVSRSFSTKFAISGASGDRFIGHPQGVYFWCPP